MRAFRDGTPATIMQQIVRGYSEEQIEVIADYFSRRPR
jgi:cytochrome c553